MTGDELRGARATLGEMWGLGRPLKMAELGRALRLGGRDPGESIRDYEHGKTPISGPVSVAVEMWLKGAPPPDGASRRALGRRNGEPLGSGFANWLAAQRQRPDAVGQVARRAVQEDDYPFWPGTADRVRRLVAHMHSDELMAGLKQAEAEYDRHDPDAEA